MNDKFSQKVKDLVAGRVGYRCSNPDCRRHTIGPNLDPERITKTGEACHIRAMSPNGKRFDINQSSSERSSANNAIWLCTECHAKIDRDEKYYTVERLLKWRSDHEAEAWNRGGIPPKPWVYALMVVGCVFLISIASYWHSLKFIPPSSPDTAGDWKQPEDQRFTVSVVGRVQHPGDYEVDSTPLSVKQLVQMAGDLTQDASGKIQVIRDGRPLGLFTQREARKLNLRPRDLLVAQSSDIIQTNAETVQIWLVNVVDHPIGFKWQVKEACLESIVQFLNQNESLASQVQVVLPSAFSPEEQLESDILLPSETVVIFPPYSVDKSRLPDELARPPQRNEPHRHEPRLVPPKPLKQPNHFFFFPRPLRNAGNPSSKPGLSGL